MREQIAQHRVIQRASRQPVTTAMPPDDDNDFTDDSYALGMPRSALRYPVGRPYTIQQGNRRIVFHPEPSPKPRKHWLVFVGIGMIVSLLLWAGVQMLGAWWSAHQLDATYGNPRTYQVDAVVGHADSTDHPSHFIVLNLKGRVVIIELPGGNIAHARIYNGPAIVGDNPAQIPATADFQDVNGDGKIDLIVHLGNQQFTYINDGTQFKPQQ
jgi:hypothetical protein